MLESICIYNSYKIDMFRKTFFCRKIIFENRILKIDQKTYQNRIEYIIRIKSTKNQEKLRTIKH